MPQFLTHSSARCAIMIGIALLTGAPAGCRACLDCDDDTYAAYGGAWQRTNPSGGRVGSVLSEAGARVADYSPRPESYLDATSESPATGAAPSDDPDGEAATPMETDAADSRLERLPEEDDFNDPPAELIKH